MTTTANQSAAANGLSAVRSSVAGNRERAVRSTAAAEAVAELGRSLNEDVRFSFNACNSHRMLDVDAGAC